MARYLSKSKFKTGLECPTKLFYTGKKEYYNKKLDDQFLEALAKGGYQIGELAKFYYPKGIDIKELEIEVSLAKTNEYLTNPEVTIFEAAFNYENLFIRSDIIVKSGNKIDLIEVKAKDWEFYEIQHIKNINNTALLLTGIYSYFLYCV